MENKDFLDLLIDEISSILGITKEEVKKRFTINELTNLYFSSLCNPIDESSIGIDSFDFKCLNNQTNNISKIDLTQINSFIKNSSEDSLKKINECISGISKLNNKLKEDIDLYIEYSIILEKLIEYRDNFIPIVTYFEEKLNEANKILFAFNPIIDKINYYKNEITNLKKEIKKYKQKIKEILDLVEKESRQINKSEKNTIFSYDSKITSLEKKISDLNKKINYNNVLLKNKEKKYPIFSSFDFNAVRDSIGKNSETFWINEFIKKFFNNNFSINFFDSELKKYSTCLSASTNLKYYSNVEQFINNSIINFSLDFINLEYLIIEKENYDESTGSRTPYSINFPIKNNKLLNTNSFFKSINGILNIRNKEIQSDPTGIIYSKYYNLLKDPINNFFSINERGLTDNENFIDSRLKNIPGASEKIENGKKYWISNLDLMQNFYKEFESKFNIKKEKIRENIIIKEQENIRKIIIPLVKLEVMNLLALGGVNKYSINEKNGKLLKTIISKIEDDYKIIINRLKDLDNEIFRIKNKIEELKPTAEKVKSDLKKYSSNCIKEFTEDSLECEEIKSLLGSDPFFVKTLKGCDPTLPNFTQLCYWKEFANLVNLVGLLPIPNIPNVNQLRYWPVGLIIPYPGGMAKIPLPIIWVPLISISFSIGTFVIFLTINGIFISPIVFFVSSSGFKQFIISIRGSSNKIGYDSNDQSIKSNISVPLSFLSLKESKNNINLNNNLTQNELNFYTKYKKFLEDSEKDAIASSNNFRLKRIKKEKNNLEKALKNVGNYQRLEEIINSNLNDVSKILDDIKFSISQRIIELGQPLMENVNKIKEEIRKRESNLYSDLIKSLEKNDIESAKKIRIDLQSDGIDLSKKIEAIKKDAIDYFNKIKFPKISIPKDKSKLNPKQNAIDDFILSINDYTNIFRSKYIPDEHLSIKTWMLTSLAKAKDEIKEKINSKYGNSKIFNVDDNKDKIISILKDINEITLNFAIGNGESIDFNSQINKIQDLTKKLQLEKNKTNKKQIEKELNFEKNKLSLAFDNEFIKQSFAISPQTFISLSNISIDFNPFSPCCKKNPIKLNLENNFNSTQIISNTVNNISNNVIKKLDSNQLKRIFNGKTQVSINEIINGYSSIINNNISSELKIPDPGLNPISFFSSFSGLFLSMIEPKASLISSSFSNSFIDFNKIKSKLNKELSNFIDQILPSVENKNYLESNILLKTSSCDDSSNIIINSLDNNKNIYPQFQNIDKDFLSINSNDINCIITTFIENSLEDFKKNIEDLYKSITNSIPSFTGPNLNIIEFSQFKVPPVGPQLEAFTNLIELQKSSLPKSYNFNMIDLNNLSNIEKTLETSLKSVMQNPLSYLTIASSGALDSSFPSIKTIEIDPNTKSILTKDLKPSTFALRSIHPILNHDDIPPWERLSINNLLFVIFLDDFISNAADKVGFFREYL